MLLVFFVILIIILLILFFRIEIKIEKFQYLSHIKKISEDSRVYIDLYIFNFIKILRLKYNEEKLNKIMNNKKLKNIDKKIIIGNLKKIKANEIIKKIEFKYLDLNIRVGVKDFINTCYIVTILSTILSMVNTKLIFKEKYYTIYPIFENKNKIDINLKCIISIKLVNIIYIILSFLRKRVDKNDRTSNRGAYAYSHE